MIAKYRKIVTVGFLTAILACTATPLRLSAGDISDSTEYQNALKAWGNRDYTAAFDGFIRARKSGAAFARSQDAQYYLLTAGCRHENLKVRTQALILLKTRAKDARSAMLDDSAWAETYRREAENCASNSLPGPLPASIVLTSHVKVRPGLAFPSSHNIYKSPGGSPFENGMVANATSPTMIYSSLPDSLLSLERRNPAHAQQVVNQLLGDRARVGQHAILIRASNTVSDYDLQVAGKKIDRFTRQLVDDFGLPEPDHYFFVVVYTSPDTVVDDDTTDGILPSFPRYDWILGVSDTRTGTSYVLAKAEQTGTAFHELTHLFVDAALGPDAPEWLNEGLASLYEQTSIRNNEFIGDRNYRAWWLTCNKGKIDSAQQLITAGWYLNGQLMEELNGDPGVTTALGTQAGVRNAGERYFMRFLQERGLLKQVVRYYVHLDEDDDGNWPLQTPQGQIKTFEKASGKSIAAINADYAKWLTFDLKAGAGPMPQTAASTFRMPTGCSGLFNPMPSSPSIHAPSIKAKRHDRAP